MDWIPPTRTSRASRRACAWELWATAGGTWEIRPKGRHDATAVGNHRRRLQAEWMGSGCARVRSGMEGRRTMSGAGQYCRGGRLVTARRGGGPRDRHFPLDWPHQEAGSTHPHTPPPYALTGRSLACCSEAEVPEDGSRHAHMLTKPGSHHPGQIRETLNSIIAGKRPPKECDRA